MKNILYYPYINVPRTDWTLRTLLYYDNIGSIVPQEYFYNPTENYEPFMLELVQSNLVVPINPMDVLENPWEITRPFLNYIEENRERLRNARQNFALGHRRFIHGDKFSYSRIHAEKFNENVFHRLENLGLAERTDGRWFLVERKTARSLMLFLATIVAAKTERQPITDYIQPFFRSTFISQQRKREIILAGLIPFPEEIDLFQLRRFKERHSDLLETFRTRVELLVLDPNIIEGSRLFDESLRELLQRKHELAAKMNESQFRNIIFGTVCGIAGAFAGLAAASTTGAFVGALPGFINAIHSALKIERAENVFDQSGLKYLALADKRLRSSS
ncbi:MAG: kinase [Bacteroidetes bacterium]|nr:kinase [Bacteroidota bacterium]